MKKLKSKNALKKAFSSLLLALMVMSTARVQADDSPFTLRLDAGGERRHVNSTFYGLMTEEINHSYDGGLYAELIRNRSFQDDAKCPAHWSALQKDGQASIDLDSSSPVNKSLPMSVRLTVTKAGKQTGLANEGFWGIPVKPDTSYRVTFFARSESKSPLRVSFQSDEGAVGYPEAQLDGISNQWQRYTVTLKTDHDVKASKGNHFVISPLETGTFWFTLVSVMPPTWKDRPNGCRPDLMQLMADLHPTFLRCPGGNYLEGYSVETRFNWKNTLGDISDRPGHMGTWSYRSSDGLGLLEFLEWAEDIGARPVLAVYGGYSLPSNEHKGGISVPVGEKLKPFVDEAVEEIEYAIGSPKSKWGARRVADGHQAPFRIEYVEIGNEDFNGIAGKTYDARFTQFYDALKAAYPQLKYIATVPVKTRTPDAYDDHYYNTSDEMAALAHQYDLTSRHGPKIFVGEWATREVSKTDAKGNVTYVRMPWVFKGEPTPALHAALGDAAFMTGLERNADVVVMNCYAPMMTRVEPGAGQWCPNMIGYDALTSFGSPSYYAQQMFNLNIGDEILGTTMPKEPANCFYSATRSSKTGTVFIKVVNRANTPTKIAISFDGIKTVNPDGRLIQLTGSDPQAVNSIAEPTKIAPTFSPVHGLGTEFTQTFPANSLTVLDLETK